ncbi:MAG TPA: NUDIX hydrolase [Armatimonadota bacterium]|jgi:ADP-ribose pyrophosphatase YjhB (NUDIX family)
MNDIPCQKHPIPAVAAIIVEDDKILLIRRGKEPSKGCWTVPGGSVEWGETLVAAVKREILEETGLEIDVVGEAGVFDLILEGTTGSWHYVIIDYFAVRTGGELCASSDAADVCWVSLDEIDDYQLTPHLMDRLKVMGVLQGE